MDKVLQLVKHQCQLHGVRFRCPRKPSPYLGLFSEDDRTITVFLNHRDPARIRQKTNKTWEVQLAALHEMVHMWQWVRKDPNWVSEYNGQPLTDLILDYSDGDGNYDVSTLKKSAKCLMALEWEAERTAIVIADSMGVQYDRARMLRGSKAYVYSYYVTAVTGWVIPRKIRRLWQKIMPPTLEYDLTETLLEQMINIAEKHKDSIECAWVDGVWTEWPFRRRK